VEKSERSFVHASSISPFEEEPDRILIDDSERLQVFGFLPGTGVNVVWNGNSFSCVVVDEDLANQYVWDDYILRVALPGELIGTQISEFQLTWSEGSIQGIPHIPESQIADRSDEEIALPEFPDEEEDYSIETNPEEFGQLEVSDAESPGVVEELRRLIGLENHAKSSNTKYKTPKAGESHSPRSLIAEYLMVEDDDVYIVGLTSRVHNLRKNLLQSTQNKFRIGVGIYLNDDWKDQTIQRYCRDGDIYGTFSDAVLYFCPVDGDIQMVGASVRRPLILNKVAELSQSAFIHLDDSVNSDDFVGGVIGSKKSRLISMLTGKVIQSSRSAYRCIHADSISIVFEGTDKTKAVIIPTDLAMEWVEAQDRGDITDSMRLKRKRKIVSKTSRWSSYLHGSESHLNAIIQEWNKEGAL